MMCSAPITDINFLLRKICQNVNSHAKIETSRYTIQNLEWSDALVDTNDLLQCVYFITPLLIRQTNVEEKLILTIFDVIDPTVNFCELEHA